MDSKIKNKIYDAAKTFAFDTIIDPVNHMDAADEFKSGFIQGAEWLIENINSVGDSNLNDAMNLIDETLENHAKSLFDYIVDDYTEEQKLVLLDSLKYPFQEGIEWAIDNFMI